MPELVGFQTMVILDPNGMTFDTVGVFGLAFQLSFKSGSSYCVTDKQTENVDIEALTRELTLKKFKIKVFLRLENQTKVN